jgi:alpha-tubulin suppressor-like RCC1 family protein
MISLRRCALLLPFLAAPFVTQGCADERAPGILIALDVDGDVPKDIDSLRLVVKAGGQIVYDQSTNVGANAQRVPATFKLVKTGDDPTVPITARAIAYSGATAIVVNQLTATAPTDRVALLRLPVHFLCYGQTRPEATTDGTPLVTSACADDETCQAGTCTQMATVLDRADKQFGNGVGLAPQPASAGTISTESLPTVAPGDVFGGSDGDGNGTCFDVPAAFKNARQVVPDAACTIDAFAGVRNIGLVTGAAAGKSRPGIVDGLGRSIVPLWMESDWGAYTEGARLRLPPAVCQKLKDGSVTGVLASDDYFVEKSAKYANCGVWSSVRKPASAEDQEGRRIGPTLGADSGAVTDAGDASVDGGDGGLAGTSDLALVTAGSAHACAAARSGEVYCWGANKNGQLGSVAPALSPRALLVPAVGGAIAISAGASHTCALVANGRVLCWGGNDVGQLGRGTATATDAPGAVLLGAGKELTGMTYLAAGESHTCAGGPSGLFCWGNNRAQQLGINGPNQLFATAVPLAPGSVITAIAGGSPLAAGRDYTCALFSAPAGTVTCWGTNTNNEFGTGAALGATALANSAKSVPFPLAGDGAAAISGGTATICVRSAANHVYCWGANRQGALAISSVTVPSSGKALDLRADATAVVVGQNHLLLASVAGGAVSGLGSNDRYEISSSGTKENIVPIAAEFPQLSGAAAGVGFSCGIVATAGKRVVCRGENSNGQCGAEPAIVAVRAGGEVGFP